MKKRTHWIIVPLAFLVGVGCEEKQPPATGPDPAEVSAPAQPGEKPAAPDQAAPTAAAPANTVQTVANTAAAAINPEQRAEKLGFARYLPADTEVLISVQNGGKIAERAKDSKLIQALQEGMAQSFGGGIGMGRDFDHFDDEDFQDMEADDDEDAIEIEDADDDGDPTSLRRNFERQGLALVTTGEDDDEDEDDPEEPATGDQDEDEDDMDIDMPDFGNQASVKEIMDKEVSFAVGKSAADQFATAGKTYSRYQHFMIRALTRGFGESLKAGKLSVAEMFMENDQSKEIFNDLLADPESGFAALEQLNVPPIYIAFRGDPEKCDEVAKSFLSDLDMMADEDVAEPVTIERAGAHLSGHKIIGSKLVKEMFDESDREEMEEALGTENTTKLLDLIAKKNFVFTAGSLDDYMVIFLGSSEDDFALTDKPAQSLGGSPALAFADAYAEKELVTLVHATEGMTEALRSSPSGLGVYADAIREGLAAWDGPFETRDLEALLQNLSEREAALRKLGTADATGMVLFFDQGLRLESFGGLDSGAFDWETPCQLGHLGDSPDVILFSNWTGKADYRNATNAYLEGLAATAYSAASRIAELELEDDSLDEMKEFMGVFNEKFRPHVSALWDSFSADLGAGLGREGALIVDAKGTMPKIPTVPQTVLDNARCPRVTFISPVADRAKLAESWGNANAAGVKLMAAISEVVGEDIPMQEAIDSEKDGFTTWFFSLPFQTTDFIPSVTLNDKWFAASTSRQRALELLGNAEGAATPRTGVWSRINFGPIRDSAAETFKLIEENAADIFGEDSPVLEQIEQTKEVRAKVVEAMSELDDLTFHARRDNGVLRVSVHFKTR